VVKVSDGLRRLGSVLAYRRFYFRPGNKTESRMPNLSSRSVSGRNGQGNGKLRAELSIASEVRRFGCAPLGLPGIHPKSTARYRRIWKTSAPPGDAAMVATEDVAAQGAAENRRPTHANRKALAILLRRQRPERVKSVVDARK